MKSAKLAGCVLLLALGACSPVMPVASPIIDPSRQTATAKDNGNKAGGDATQVNAPVNVNGSNAIVGLLGLAIVVSPVVRSYLDHRFARRRETHGVRLLYGGAILTDSLH